jgi:hypothetical protein
MWTAQSVAAIDPQLLHYERRAGFSRCQVSVSSTSGFKVAQGVCSSNDTLDDLAQACCTQDHTIGFARIPIL